MIDSYKHKGLRRNLIIELKLKGISDQRILDAFNSIPRHFFLDSAFEKQAYSNIAFQIGAGQTISHPYTVAFQTTLLELNRGDLVLEIGTGSAFQTCILCELGAKVVSIERQRELFLKAKETLKLFKFSPRLIYGDGYKGQESLGPYDKILVTCGAPYIPNELKKQLKIGGYIVIPVGGNEKQKMLRLKKINENEFLEEVYGDFNFVPMLEKTNNIIN